MKIKPLPPDALRLCGELNAPKRLVEHLALVHDAAVRICAGIDRAWPELSFDKRAVLIGAATHDLGKVRHPSELSRPGNKHVVDGPALLRKHGLPMELTRFASTHELWQRCDALEDLLVALADHVWKGSRSESLELRVTEMISALTGQEKWKVFGTLDRILERIAGGSGGWRGR